MEPGGGGRWCCAIDGSTLTVPDHPAVLTRFTKQAGNHGGTGYPQLRLLALLACGTRTVIDAVFGPTTTGETTYAPALLRSLGPGMILLADRNFGAQGLVADIAGTGAHVLVRLKNGRKMPVLARYRDGSYLSLLGALRVRVIDCEIAISTSAGRRVGVYRLATTLLDPNRYPAAELIQLFHERWEIETAYLELKSSILGGRVLRARTPSGIEQEVYALLVVYQLIRTAMADATATRPDVDPDRASFSTALHADDPSRGRHRRHHHRPRRHHRPPRPGPPHARPAPARIPPHRQTRHLQIPGPRPKRRQDQLQGHHRHRHPPTRRPLTNRSRT